MLTFLHLSDIHFRREISNTKFDIDADLRNELERDLRSSCDGPVNGILVTGDIAFAGKTAEFDAARNWLRLLSNQLGCSEVEVWTVPGNHDIDRTIIDQSPHVQSLHRELRKLRNHDLNTRLRELLDDPIASKALFSPLEAYNTFAFSFRCDVNSKKLYWDQDFSLDDESILRLRGMTSVLVSDRHDNIDGDGGKLFLTDYQTTMHREDGVEYMTLCHHPFDWLYDADRARDRMDRAKVRLFGHKHRQRIREENGGIFLVAGAMHPDRDAEWEPRYNLISIGVEIKEGGQRVLNLQIKPRIWDDAEGSFKPDVGPSGQQIRKYPYPLPSWAAAKRFVPIVGPVVDMEDSRLDESSLPKSSLSHSLKSVDRPERMLVYRLLSLPIQQQQEIARKLELISDDEWFQEESELWKTLLARARELRRLAELWLAINSALADGRFDSYQNPFEHSSPAKRKA